MLLPLCHHQLSFPPKILTDHSSVPSSSSFFFPSTLLSPNPNKYLNFLLRTSASASASASDTHTQTLTKSAIQRIAEKLRNLGYADEEDSKQTLDSQTAGEIFIPLPHHLPKHRVGHTIDTSWTTPENPVPEPGSGTAITRFHELKGEVRKQRQSAKKKEEERVPTLAELTLPKEELRRLRGLGIELKKKLKVGKAGITEGIVNGIHERWRRSELVRIVCEDLCKMNMKRTHDTLERKTGGLVVWRSGSNIILYRGANYEYPYFSNNNSTNDTSIDTSPDSHTDYVLPGRKESCSSNMDGVKSAGPSLTKKMTRSSLIQGVGSPNRVRFQLPGEAQLAEEADCLLDGLGPRFTDWWGYDPLPVDADLLPAIVPGYRKPFRLLPYGVNPKLTNDEMTTLKRLGRPLPCHFALGRNRKLQGLAASMVKLWEKCEIAKIAVKRGVQNTNSEMMAEELKWLTGGIMLSRDREFIVLYRGKDFLPPAVSLAIEERRKCVIHGEKQRTDLSSSVMTTQVPKLGTVERTPENELDGTNDQKRNLVPEQRKLRSNEAAIKRTSIKLSMALEKKARAEKLLSGLEKAEISQQPEIDKEGITEEERYMLRKVGLRMKPFLLLGRRGVFDGTVENMHLHWKYRELVKIISGERSIEDVHRVAQTLEAESGGILVAVDRVNKGYAIIMYRGKNYKRPSCLRPQTLLNKRQAMKRSIEAQRRESLKLHVLRLTRNVDELKLQLVKDKETKSMQSAVESKLQVIKEKEMNSMPSLEYKRSDTELESGYRFCSVIPTCNQDNVEARERNGADSTSLNSKIGVDASRDGPETTQQHKLIDFSSRYEGETDKTEPESSSESVLKEIHVNVFLDMNGGGGDVDSTYFSDDLMSQGRTSCSAIVNARPHVSDNETMESSVELAKNESEPSVHRAVETGSNGIPYRAAPLSNRDRLLLRKQALKMKKRPVLAIGRSNIITGVAKAIKAHFQKHPLAIVNVKGRAKGTSVQEVVFKLEQATGAVLVSQEPSKVILYRGWGVGEPRHTDKKHTRDVMRTSAGREGGARLSVSHELMAAIRLECGLPCNQEEAATL